MISSIKSLIKQFENISKGNLTERLYIKGDDETGRLSGAFNIMAESLKSVTVKIIDESSYIGQISDKAKENISVLDSQIEAVLSTNRKSRNELQGQGFEGLPDDSGQA